MGETEQHHWQNKIQWFQELKEDDVISFILYFGIYLISDSVLSKSISYIIFSCI